MHLWSAVFDSASLEDANEMSLPYWRKLWPPFPDVATLSLFPHNWHLLDQFWFCHSFLACMFSMFLPLAAWGNPIGHSSSPVSLVISTIRLILILYFSDPESPFGSLLASLSLMSLANCITSRYTPLGPRTLKYPFKLTLLKL